MTGVSRLRFNDCMSEQGLKIWGAELVRQPFTQSEVKVRLKETYELEQGKAIARLRDCGSIASDVYPRLGLSGCLIKGALQRLSYSRPQQVALGSIICPRNLSFTKTVGCS